MKKYYIVKHTVNEYNYKNVCIKESYEEAKEVIKDTENWYERKGSGVIEVVDEYFNTLEEYSFRDNECYNVIKW